MVPSLRRTARGGAATTLRLLVAALLVAVCAVLFSSTAASAHVLPSSSVQLAVEKSDVDATVEIPLDDIAAATGLDLGDETTAEVAAQKAAVTDYLLAHFTPTSDDGTAWTVKIGDLTVAQAGNTTTTGLYQALTVAFTLTPPAGNSVRSFNLGYSVIVNKVITHVVIVTVESDWAAGATKSAYELGTIRLNTITGKVGTLHVDLGSGSELRGFVSMVVLGVQHIQEGTDHQLFLLTLLLPASLLARRRRWAKPVPAKVAVKRIGGVTLAFTIGHSITLALGALGLPVPTSVVEALIAVSILVAAAHAIRPLFPGKEVLVAGSFGLIHGLAFSTTLRELDLTGSRLVLALLGFNLGIEAMQLIVVAFVLPPLIVLAEAGRFQKLRLTAATVTGVAAVGWLIARLGLANPVATLADQLGTLSIPAVAALWIAAVIVTLQNLRVRRRTLQAEPVKPQQRSSQLHKASAR